MYTKTLLNMLYVGGITLNKWKLELFIVAIAFFFAGAFFINSNLKLSLIFFSCAVGWVFITIRTYRQTET